jgi:hypothetical protein
MHPNMRAPFYVASMVGGMIVWNMGETLLAGWHNPRNPNEASAFRENIEKARQVTVEQPKKAAAAGGHHHA